MASDHTALFVSKKPMVAMSPLQYGSPIMIAWYVENCAVVMELKSAVVTTSTVNPAAMAWTYSSAMSVSIIRRSAESPFATRQRHAKREVRCIMIVDVGQNSRINELRKVAGCRELYIIMMLYSRLFATLDRIALQKNVKQKRNRILRWNV